MHNILNECFMFKWISNIMSLFVDFLYIFYRFFQYVEDSTRPTFHLIETILHTFSSMTMLLESTYFALTNSFKAILSVAENVRKLHSTLGQLFSTFALIRFLKWLYRKIVRNTGKCISINMEFFC